MTFLQDSMQFGPQYIYSGHYINILVEPLHCLIEDSLLSKISVSAACMNVHQL